MSLVTPILNENHTQKESFTKVFASIIKKPFITKSSPASHGRSTVLPGVPESAELEAHAAAA
jgi:hypothetical protein